MRIKENRLQTYESEHAAKVAELAAECTVLLKKDGCFPLSSPRKIALYGAGARHTIRGGSGSGEVNIRHFETIEEAFLNAGFTITSGTWLDSYDDVIMEAGAQFYHQLKAAADAAGIPVAFAAIGQTVPEPEYELPLEAEGDTAVYILSRNSGEGADRKAIAGDISLTQTEIRDIHALNSAYENFILVLNVGGVVDLSPVADVKNILLLGQLGTPTAKVLVDILMGKSYPSGKLTATWAALGSYPSTDGFGDPNDTLYREGIYVGYRYFDLADKKALYPFGHGLSFTDFTIRCHGLRYAKGYVTVNVQISNIGKYPGKETVQLYVTAPGIEIDRPFKELAGTVKTEELAPGGMQNAEISFALGNHAYYDEANAAYILEGGTYLLHIGSDSKNVQCVGTVQIPSSIRLYEFKNICPPKQEIPKLPELKQMQDRRKKAYAESLAHAKEKASVTADLAGCQTERIEYTPAVSDKSESGHPTTGEPLTWNDVLDGSIDERRFAKSLTAEELALLSCGSGTDNTDMGSIIGSAAAKVAGAAGETTRKLTKSRGIPSVVLADGPAGIRISPIYTLEGETAKPAVSAFGSGMSAFLPPEELAMIKASMGVAQPDDNMETYYQYCTAIPIGTAVAQSFNPRLAEALGDIVGSEMELFGVQLWLAPALNIQRSPLCGRNFEYYSEDPLVSGTTAAAITRGVQKHPKCGVTIKHFACNNQETNRYRSNSIISERALREIYLKGFELCVRTTQPAAIMTSYNLINGEHACNSRDLLTHVLRDEWKFNGIVMTDWFVSSAQIGGDEGSVHPAASAAGCVKAGNHLVMPGLATDLTDIRSALKEPSHNYPLCHEELVQNAVQVLRFIRMFS